MLAYITPPFLLFVVLYSEKVQGTGLGTEEVHFGSCRLHYVLLLYKGGHFLAFRCKSQPTTPPDPLRALLLWGGFFALKFQFLWNFYVFWVKNHNFMIFIVFYRKNAFYRWKSINLWKFIHLMRIKIYFYIFIFTFYFHKTRVYCCIKHIFYVLYCVKRINLWFIRIHVSEHVLVGVLGTCRAVPHLVTECYTSVRGSTPSYHRSYE